MAGRKRELYEILAAKSKAYSQESDSRTLPGEMESAAWREESSVITSQGSTPIQETRELAEPPLEEIKRGELIIDFNTGLAALLVVLIMLGTAAYLGYRAGIKDEGNRLRIRIQEEERGEIYEGSAMLDEEVREERSGALLWPADTLVLTLISFNMSNQADWNKAKDTLAYARNQAVLAETGLEAHILSDGKVYFVVVGPFKNRTDPQIKKVQDAFRKLPGPRTTTGYGQYPYEGSHLEEFEKLGRAVDY
ncbi:MAG: hypothetical protein JXA52_05890 [Planctomycetes bacterium]|nr:hypothetical protein [Planctomycetota bacterium]